eukprot:8973680-Ditylum_brightwellii.AAC.1
MTLSFPEPENDDTSLYPPTEKDVATPNSKYGFKETFRRLKFTGKDTNILQCRTYQSQGRKRLSSTWRQAVPDTISKPQERGGPWTHFYKKCGLDKKIHPADWVNALLPLTPEDNLGDLSEIDVTGDRLTKFCVANWTAYTSTKAMMANAGGLDHIFAGC